MPKYYTAFVFEAYFSINNERKQRSANLDA